MVMVVVVMVVKAWKKRVTLTVMTAIFVVGNIVTTTLILRCCSC